MKVGIKKATPFLLAPPYVSSHESKMDENSFWQLIDSSIAGSKGDRKRQIELLESKLAALSEDDIFAYYEIFQGQQDLCYGDDFWKVATELNGPTSDDGFECFQAWLISLGKEVFSKALKDPQSLLEGKSGKGKCAYEFEEMLYAPMNAYKKKTGKDWYGE